MDPEDVDVPLVAHAELLEDVARPAVLRARHRDDPRQPDLVEAVGQRRAGRLRREPASPRRPLEGVEDLDLPQLVDGVEAALAEKPAGRGVLDGEDAEAFVRPVPDELSDRAP